MNSIIFCLLFNQLEIGGENVNHDDRHTYPRSSNNGYVSVHHSALQKFSCQWIF